MRDSLNFPIRDPQKTGTSGHEGMTFARKIFSSENIWAFLLFIIVMALIVFTTDDGPVWIYQGF